MPSRQVKNPAIDHGVLLWITTALRNERNEYQSIAASGKLQKHGHAIGSHNVNHLRAVEYCKKHSIVEFLENETLPQLTVFKEVGVAPTSFTYPMSNNNETTDIALRQSSSTFQEKSRSIPIAGRSKALVCGGGPAGIGAALAAARCGAETQLLELV